MINQSYRIYAPRQFRIDMLDEKVGENDLIIRPTYLSICAADIRYYTGNRNAEILKKKFPMALIHEAVGEVLYDPKNKIKRGTHVVLIPNVKTEENKIIKENYLRSSKFKSSGIDGFMQEIVIIDRNRVIPYHDVDDKIAVLSELLSVSVNAIEAFQKCSHEIKNSIGIWGNGNVGFATALLLKKLYPTSKIIIFGTTEEKLSYFSFADERYLITDIPTGLKIDHAFECVGGLASSDAINQIIDYINPQGTIALMGVSENNVPINTRMVLEKGISLVGNSRSSYEDFDKVVHLLEENSDMCEYLKTIISNCVEVNQFEDIKIAFDISVNSTFKTIMKWNV